MGYFVSKAYVSHVSDDFSNFQMQYVKLGKFPQIIFKLDNLSISNSSNFLKFYLFNQFKLLIIKDFFKASTTNVFNTSYFFFFS